MSVSYSSAVSSSWRWEALSMGRFGIRHRENSEDFADMSDEHYRSEAILSTTVF